MKENKLVELSMDFSVDMINLVKYLKANHETIISRASLNTQRAARCEGFFRQTKQKSARIVDPMRKNFVTYDGKSTVISACDEFLEMPHSYYTTDKT